MLRRLQAVALASATLGGQRASVVRVRNRRYQRMVQLLREGEYFSEAAMEARAPALFHKYVSRHRIRSLLQQRSSAHVADTLAGAEPLIDKQGAEAASGAGAFASSSSSSSDAIRSGRRGADGVMQSPDRPTADSGSVSNEMLAGAGGTCLALCVISDAGGAVGCACASVGDSLTWVWSCVLRVPGVAAVHVFVPNDGQDNGPGCTVGLGG